MDILMPIMNGIEATKIIHKTFPSIMIIVISSENDENTKKNILNFGAEDYILKPLSSSIMLKRLNNYSKLISTRNSINFQTQAINNFTNKIYSYQMKFFISNDDELSQFWETLLIRLDFQNHIEQLSDFVRFVFNLGIFQINKSYKFHLYIEEDEDFFYFSMDGMKLLSNTTINEITEKYCPKIIHKQQDNYISFALPKIIQVYQLDESKNSLKLSKEEPNIKEKELFTESLQTYNILDSDALNEFEFLLTKLKTEIMLMGSSSLDIEDIDTLNNYAKEIVTLLNSSQDTYSIAQSLIEFTDLLDESSEEFLSMSKDLSQMMQSFINDLITWKEMIFYTGAPSIDFLNNSINSNVQMIKALFTSDEDDNQDLDDIFNF